MRIRNELPIVEGRAIPKERRNEGGGVGTGGEPTAGGGSHQELNRDQEPKRQMKRGEVNSRNYQEGLDRSLENGIGMGTHTRTPF